MPSRAQFKREGSMLKLSRTYFTSTLAGPDGDRTIKVLMSSYEQLYDSVKVKQPDAFHIIVQGEKEQSHSSSKTFWPHLLQSTAFSM